MQFQQRKIKKGTTRVLSKLLVMLLVGLLLLNFAENEKTIHHTLLCACGRHLHRVGINSICKSMFFDLKKTMG